MHGIETKLIRLPNAVFLYCLIHFITSNPLAMKKLLLFTAIPVIMLGAVFLLNSNSTTPLSTVRSDLAVEATYIGSEDCGVCHESKYNDWVASGHPYKFTIIEGGVAPTYPAEAVNFQSQYMDSLGDGSHTWNDIAGVIGGYGWKARFVGTDGHIVGTLNSAFSTGLAHNQMNYFVKISAGSLTSVDKLVLMK
jgi:hypothetical protein